MTTALIVMSCLFLLRELAFLRQYKQWQEERQDLYNRIQAGTLQEYQQATREPSPPIVKDREQRVAEQCAELGLPREAFQYPPIWKG